MTAASIVGSSGNSVVVNNAPQQPEPSSGLSLPSASVGSNELAAVAQNVNSLAPALELVQVRQHHSRMDNTKEITRDLWAITMICAANSNHAQLVIEGVKINNSRFTYLADLTGRANSSGSGLAHGAIGQVNYRAFTRPTTRPIRFSGKSETWLVARNLMQTMLRQIKNEANDPDNHPRAFHITGRSSSLPRRVIYVRGEGVKELSWGKTIKAEVVGLFGLGPLKYLPLISMPWNVYLVCNRGAVADGLLAYASSPNTDNGWNGLRDVKEAELYKMSLDLARRHGGENVKILKPDNCISWAKEKLRMVNIIVQDGTLDRIVTLTRVVTHPNASSVRVRSST